MDYSLLSSATNDKYIDIDSNYDSYGTELTIFNSNADSNADSNANSDADCDADSSINCDDDSIIGSYNAYEAPA